MNKPIPLTASTLGAVRLAILSYYFLSGLCFSSWASRIPEIKASLGMSDAAWGTMLLMMPVGQITGMLFSGRLVPLWGSKRVLLGSMVGYGLSLIAIGLADSVWALGTAMVVMGFFGNFHNIAENTQACTVENYCGRPIMSTFHGGWSLAGLLGGGIGLGVIALGITPFWHFAIIGSLAAVGSVLCFRWLQPDMRHAPEPAADGTVAKARPERFLYLLGIVAFLGLAAEGAMSDWNGLYLQDVVGAPKHLAPLGLTAYMLTMATGRFVMDRVTHRWGRRRVLQFCGAAIFTGLTLAVVYPGMVMSLVAFMIVGFGTCGIVPTVYSTTGQHTRIATGRALTIVSSIGFLGFLLGPPVIGYISNLTNLRVSYALIACFGLGITLMVARMRIFREKA